MTGSGFIMNLEFSGVLDVSTDFRMPSPSSPKALYLGGSSAEPKEWRPKALYLGGSTPQPKDPDQR